MRYQQQIDIRKKILIPIILISLVGVLLTVFLMLYLMGRQIDENLKDKLSNATFIIKEEIKEEENWLVPDAISISNNPTIAREIELRDKNSLIKELLPYLVTYSIDSIEITDNTGRNIVRLGPTIPTSKMLSNSELSLKRVAFFTESKHELWVTAISPRRSNNGQLAESIKVANRLDEAFLKRIRDKTGLEVVVEFGNLRIGSSNKAVDLVTKARNGRESYKSSGGFADNSLLQNNQYLIDRFDIITSGGAKATAYTLISASNATRAKTVNTLIILLANLAVLLLLIIVAYFVSKNISKPLSVMTERARLIAKGSYMQRIDYSGIREIDELTSSFNIMSEGLEENRIRLEEQAYTDSLTGLYNHRYFHDSLSNEVNRVLRYHHPLSLIVTDIDDFKRINDTFGHKKGDIALKVLAEKIRESIRKTDIACRIGGEEFGIILPETTLYEAFAVAERLRLDISAQPIDDVGKITISVGIATFPDHANDKDGLIESADTAMYQAKRQGKNLTLVYNYEVLDDSGEEDLLVEENYYIDTLHALAAAVDAKDQYTRSHSEYVASFASLIGHEIGLSPSQIEHLRIAGLLHDVGKIGIPDSILKKTGALTDEEFQEIRLHPIFSERILTRTKLEPVLKAIIYHHERLDGSGYPYGLLGDEIPLDARILAVADAFEAMVSDRSYRKALSVEAAIGELQKDSSEKLDKNVVDALIRVVERDESVRNIIAKRNRETASA